jgi:hypothetical protein
VGDSAYVAAEGRGVYGVPRISSAPIASTFTTVASATQSSTIAVLKKGDGNPVMWDNVVVSVRDSSNGQSVLSGKVRTGEMGELIPPPLPSGSYVVDLAFPGDQGIAPTRAKYTMTMH